jgi:RHS repeat-associated protein
VLYFHALGSDNHGRWDLYDNPTSPTQINGAGLTSDFAVTLPASGTYVLVLTGQQSSNAAVDYSFQILAPATTTTPLSLGATIQGNLAQPGASASYTFLGRVGQRIVYDALQASTPGLNAELTSPSGLDLYIANAANEPSPFTLAEAGTYTLTILGSGNSTGTFAFRLLDVASATPLVLAAPTSGTLSPGLSDAVYSVSGTAGQRLSFQSQSLPGASGTWVLYGPENQFIAQGPALASTFTANLPTAGAYVLVIAGSSATAPVNYQFTVMDTSQTPVAPSGFNTIQSGTVAAGQSVPFSFSAPAGLPIYFNGISATGSLTVVLKGPAGNTVFQVNPASNAAGPFLLTSSGNYVLTFSGTSPSATGTFQFQLLDLANGSTTLALNTPTSGSLNPSMAAVSYSLTVPVGQRVVYNALTSSSSGVQALLYSAGGATVLNTDANNDSNLLTLLAGRYSLILVGTKSTSSSYSFQLLNANTAPALPVDMGAVTGTLTPGTGATLYSLSGLKGETIYLHPTSSPGPGSWLLYESGNQSIANAALNNDLTATFPTTGTYLLALLGGSTSGPISYSFTVHLVNTVTQPIPTTATVSGTTTYTYNAFSEVTSETDPLGRVTNYSYDAAGNLKTKTQVVGSGGANNLVTTSSYDSHGLVTKQVDPAGRETDYTYDADERLSTVTTAVGTPDQASVSYTLDPAGNILTTTDGNNHTTTNTYDSLNRLLTATDPLNNTTTNTYDAAGNLLTTRDASGHVTTYAYDPYGHVIKATNAQAGVTTSTYDAAGNLMSVTDPLGNVTRYQYDARNRLIATINPAGNVTRQVYDGASNVIAVIDPDGNQTSYTYDALNRLVRSKDALGNSTLYTYDADGEVVSRTDGNGQVINDTYDGAGRLITEAWQGTSEVINTTYNPDGQVTSVSDPNSSLTYTYDGQGRVKTVDNTSTPGAPHVVLTYTYDPAGNVLSLADTVGGQAEGLNAYTYNADNQLTKIIQTGAALAGKQVDFTYNPLGQFATISRYSDAAGTQLVATSTYSYDTLNRLTGLADSQGATTLASYTLSDNANNLVTKRVDPDGTATYTYDALGQLTGATDSSSSIPPESYTYDANGNRLTSGTSVTYQIGTNNQLLSDGTYNYQYDNNGNLVLRTKISDGSTESYTYDARNRLVAVIDKNGAGHQTQAVSTTYDALNRRISESVTTAAGTTVTYFIYDGSSNVLLEYQSAGSGSGGAPVLKEHNLFGPAVDQVLAQDASSSGGKVSWLLADDLGSIRDVLDSSGVKTDHLVYDSFGNLLSQTNAAAAPRYQFTGRELDSATGLYFDRARYYNSATGRFLTEDPIGFAGGQANLYAYVDNDPTTLIDPFGTGGPGLPGLPTGNPGSNPTGGLPGLPTGNTGNNPTGGLPGLPTGNPGSNPTGGLPGLPPGNTGNNPTGNPPSCGP